MNDAKNAVSEGDLSAGFYHGRTLLEHFLKYRQKLDLASHLRGEELIKTHNEKLSEKLKTTLPSLSTAFTGLSEHLHARTGEKADFDRLVGMVCDHIEMLALVEKYH